MYMYSLLSKSKHFVKRCDKVLTPHRTVWSNVKYQSYQQTGIKYPKNVQ